MNEERFEIRHARTFCLGVHPSLFLSLSLTGERGHTPSLPVRVREIEKERGRERERGRGRERKREREREREKERERDVEYF